MRITVALEVVCAGCKAVRDRIAGRPIAWTGEALAVASDDPCSRCNDRRVIVRPEVKAG